MLHPSCLSFSLMRIIELQIGQALRLLHSENEQLLTRSCCLLNNHDCNWRQRCWQWRFQSLDWWVTECSTRHHPAPHASFAWTTSIRWVCCVPGYARTCTSSDVDWYLMELPRFSADVRWPRRAGLHLICSCNAEAKGYEWVHGVCEVRRDDVRWIWSPVIWCAMIWETLYIRASATMIPF